MQKTDFSLRGSHFRAKSVTSLLSRLLFCALSSAFFCTHSTFVFAEQHQHEHRVTYDGGRQYLIKPPSNDVHPSKDHLTPKTLQTNQWSELGTLPSYKSQEKLFFPHRETQEPQCERGILGFLCNGEACSQDLSCLSNRCVKGICEQVDPKLYKFAVSDDKTVVEEGSTFFSYVGKLILLLLATVTLGLCVLFGICFFLGMGRPTLQRQPHQVSLKHSQGNDLELVDSKSQKEKLLGKKEDIEEPETKSELSPSEVSSQVSNNKELIKEENGAIMQRKSSATTRQQGEIISVHVGQAGINLANQIWETFCVEHGMNPDGSSLNARSSQRKVELMGLFSRKRSNELLPHSVFLDLEPSAVDNLRSGPFRGLFQDDCFVTGKEDASSLFSLGRDSYGRDLKDECLDAIRVIAEQCDHLKGFMMYNAVGGGTGSGLGALMLQSLGEQFGVKTNRLALSIYPADQLSVSPTEPFNALLHTDALLEHADMSFTIENEALLRIYKQKLNKSRPRYTDLNRLLARVISNLTVAYRFESPYNVDFNDYLTNLVPYPKMHFLLTSHSPIVSRYGEMAPNPENPATIPQTITDLTHATFQKENMLVSCDPASGKYMACCLQYRGLLGKSEPLEAIQDLRMNSKTIKFVDWCRTGYKVGFNQRQIGFIDDGDIAQQNKEITMLANSTAISQVFTKFNRRFDKMYSRRAYVHHYVSTGMEEGELYGARENLQLLEADYKEAHVNTMPIAIPQGQEMRSKARLSVQMAQTVGSTTLQTKIDSLTSKIGSRQDLEMALEKQQEEFYSSGRKSRKFLVEPTLSGKLRVVQKAPNSCPELNKSTKSISSVQNRLSLGNVLNQSRKLQKFKRNLRLETVPECEPGDRGSVRTVSQAISPILNVAEGEEEVLDVVQNIHS